MNKLIKDTLKPLNIPVSLHEYDGSENTYITFFEYTQQGEAYSENEEDTTGYYYQINVWSNKNYSSIVKDLKNRMKNAGFVRKTEFGLYDKQTKMFNKVLRFVYLKLV
jgi:hypothetical protein